MDLNKGQEIKKNSKVEKIVHKDHQTGKTCWPDVYVLMRIYCADVSGYSEFLKKLTDSLESIQKNKTDYESKNNKNVPGKIVFLFNDDTIRGEKVEQYNDYKSALHEMLSIFGDEGEGWCETRKDLAKEPGGMGSSYSAYLVRSLFLQKAKEDDIAISLDQDDLLKTGAIRNIARSMYRGGVVVSPFRMKDPKHLDITDDGGRIHNRIARLLSCRVISGCIVKGKTPVPKKEYNKLFFPLGKNEWKELWSVVKNNFSLFWKRFTTWFHNLFTCKSCVSDLSSIGWTKSYTKKPLETYHNDLTQLLVSRGGVEKYYEEHRSFEDFVDYYVFLFKSIRIGGTREATHDYLKNPSSITSTPTVEDFRDQRTASLITLIDLCYAKQRMEEQIEKNCKVAKCSYAELCNNYKIKLQRFVASKVYQIEKIIDQYNTDFSQKGKNEYAAFAAQTHRGYFISKLARLALGEKREGLKQDDELFFKQTSRFKASSGNFSDLFSEGVFNNNPYYKEKINASSPRYVLRRAVAIEKRMRWRRNKGIENEKKSNLMSGSLTPNQRRLKSLRIVRWICLGVLLLLIGCLIFFGLPLIADELKIESNNKYFATVREFQTLLAAFIALVGVITTIIENEIGKVKILAADEVAAVKLYYSEFHDFIRHLEANVKVMIQIRKEIQKEEGLFNIQSIHFDNLKWPASSCLFSDEMAKLIARDRVDDFARLKVNLRNINNSAQWLQSLAQSGVDMKEILEWEITRYFGYLVNMYYLDRNDFCFPSPDEIDRYMHENSIKNKFTSLFMDYEAKERLAQVDYFIDKYNDDRRMRRAVLVK